MSLFGRIAEKIITDRPPLSAAGAAIASFPGMGGSSSRRDIALMGQFDATAATFAVVSRIMSAFAAVEWELHRGTRKESVIVEEHPLLDLWENPNPFYTGEEFREVFQQHLDLTGESFWLLLRPSINAEPEEIWPLRPDRVSPIPHPQEFISGWRYRIGTDVFDLPVENVVFPRYPDPLNPLRGLGPMQAISTDVRAAEEASRWNERFFANSAEPGGVIQMSRNLDDQQYKKFVDRWNTSHRGTANAHRVAVLENAEWKERKITQRDMQFSSLTADSINQVLLAYGMPRSVMGITENVNRANAEAGEVTFARWVLTPRLRRIQGVLNRRLAPMFGDDLFFKFIDPIPVDRETEATIAVALQRGGVTTVNENRRRVGEDELENEVQGNARAGLPFVKAEIQEAARLFGSMMINLNEAREMIDLPPIPGGELIFGSGGATAESESDDPEGAVAAGAALLENIQWRMLKSPGDPGGIKPTPIDQAEIDMADAWQRRLSSEAENIIDYLEVQAGEVVAAGFAGLTKIENGDQSGYPWNWEEKFLDDIVEEIAKAWRIAAAAEFPGMPTAELQRLSGEFARARGENLVRFTGNPSVVKATQDRLNILVAESVENGESLGELSKKLRDDFGFSKDRAETIARTETAESLGAGSEAGATAEGKDEKFWDTQGDSQVDAPCLENEAKGWIAITESFPSGKNRIPDHPNCRCVNRYRLSADAQADIDASEGLAEETAEAIEQSRGEPETESWGTFCPTCEGRLNLNLGDPNQKDDKSALYCSRCHKTYRVKDVKVRPL